MITGYDNKQVFVRHGGSYLRINPCNLQHIKKAKEVQQPEEVECRSDTESKEKKEIMQNSADLADMIELDNKVMTPHNTQECLTDEENEQNTVNELAEMISQIDLLEDDNVNRNPTKAAGVIPSIKSKITYQESESNLWKRAVVMSRAGKATGRNKYWFNVKDLDNDSMRSVDFENVSSWKNINEEVLISKNETFEVTEAKLRELENWKNNKVYQEVDDENQSKISVRWVITEVIEGVFRTKARLVARGFEGLNLNIVRTDSPTCGRENLRLLFCIIASFDWGINTIDIRAAFLQGKPIERDVFLKPPKEAQTDKIWKLNISVYGLCGAPTAWYLSVKEELAKTGGIKCKYDDAIFHWYQGNKLEEILASHVDEPLEEAIELAIMTTCMLLDILKIEYNNKILPIKCITDSNSLHDAVYSSKEVTEKRLKIELCAIRESLEKGEVTSVLWTNSKNQLADCLTKEGASHDKLYDALSEKIKLYPNS